MQKKRYRENANDNPKAHTAAGGESFTLAPPKVIYDSASTPLRASSSNTPGDVPTSQNSTSLLGHLNKKREIQYNAKECTSKAEDMKMLQLLDSELDLVNKKSQLMDMKIKLAQIELTNARLSQLKAYYELKTLENELAIPAAESFNKLIELDIAALPKSN
ncbi:uncharacterized protein LOC112567812 isoform X2 [Pomacea canaliculata]|uniref:uncharacterized protein LOC112567812 isoform X2 n=1 Tax=Pomacea canaliculata TaxID=400727 RepID=UPI000D735267|nr:uncharacterized protein LOC112567812 isoform X2 [Pomacea canaliculata]